MPFLSDLDADTAAPSEGSDQLARFQMGRSITYVEMLLMHTVYLATLGRRTFVLLAVTSVMKNSDETVDDCFAFFSREELLEQQCLLLESELVVMGEELTASCEKIAALVLMWTGIRDELRRAEAELSRQGSSLI